MFKEEDTQARTEEPGAEQPKTKPTFSAEYKDKTLWNYLKMFDQGTSWLAAMIVGMDDKRHFDTAEESLQMLYTSLEPYKDVIVEALPPWIPVTFIFAGIITEKVGKVLKIRKANTANAAGKRNPGTMGKIGDALGKGGERKNYVLWKDGYYKFDRSGIYVKREEVGKLEKPSMEDIDKILAVQANCHRDLINAAFDCTEADYATMGIDASKITV